LQTALAQARAVNKDSEAAVAKVEAAVANLKAAIDHLVKAAPTPEPGKDPGNPPVPTPEPGIPPKDKTPQPQLRIAIRCRMPVIGLNRC